MRQSCIHEPKPNPSGSRAAEGGGPIIRRDHSVSDRRRYVLVVYRRRPGGKCLDREKTLGVGALSIQPHEGSRPRLRQTWQAYGISKGIGCLGVICATKMLSLMPGFVLSRSGEESKTAVTLGCKRDSEPVEATLNTRIPNRAQEER